MTANDFVKMVRAGDDKLRIDDVVMNSGQQQFHGKGMMKITHERIEIDVTPVEVESIPEPQMGIFTAKDSWTVTGLIEDQLKFVCTRAHRRPGLMSRITLDLHPIELVPGGWDAMSRTERDQMFKRIEQSESNKPSNPTESAKTLEDDFSFGAILYEYPLLQTAPGNQVKGETITFEYELNRDTETSDLHVNLRSKTGHSSSGDIADWTKFNAFMNAIAFANGVHAWPYRVEYYRAGKKITDRVTVAERLAKTSHSPFSKALAFAAQTGSTQWALQNVLGLAASFFEQDTALSRETSWILFLFREADDGVHQEITTIALCTLFENFVQLLFREFQLEKSADLIELKAFQDAKADVDAHLEALAKNKQAYRGIQNYLQNADFFPMRRKFRTVVNHLGLQWEGDMEEVFKTWSQTRNAIVHDKTRADQSDEQIRRAVRVESRIAGAINILMLKAIGYTGLLRHSALEDGYRRI